MKGAGRLRAAPPASRVVQLAFCIGLGALPGPFSPGDVPQAGVGTAVHAGAQVDQALRLLDQSGQDVGRKGVDGEEAGSGPNVVDRCGLKVLEVVQE